MPKKGQFQKGQSGNPAGRPKGTKDAIVAMRELLVPHAPALVQKAVEMALNGDAAALRICVDRLIPPAKARDESVSLPLGEGSLTEKGNAVLTALGNGELAPDVATAVLQGIAAQVRIIETDEISRRLDALEAAADARGGFKLGR